MGKGGTDVKENKIAFAVLLPNSSCFDVVHPAGISSRRRIWRKAKRHFSNAAGETKLPLPNRANAAASLLPGKDAKKLRAPKKYRRTFWEKEEPT